MGDRGCSFTFMITFTGLWTPHGRTNAARGAADDDGGAGAAAEIGLAGADGDAFSAAVKKVAVLDNNATAAGIDIAIPGVVAPAGDEAGIAVGNDQAVLGQGRGVIDDDAPGAVDAADKVGQALFALPLELIEALVVFPGLLEEVVVGEDADA